MPDRRRSDAAYPARRRYQGREARGYDQRRTATTSRRRKWAAESTSLGAALERLPAESTILDLPCGTGRFLTLVRDLGLECFDTYLPLVASGGLVVFHDIRPGDPCRGGAIPRFWSEVKSRFEHQEILAPSGSGFGIGVLWK